MKMFTITEHFNLPTDVIVDNSLRAIIPKYKDRSLHYVKCLCGHPPCPSPPPTSSHFYGITLVYYKTDATNFTVIILNNNEVQLLLTFLL